jgi:hypothetical protein
MRNAIREKTSRESHYVEKHDAAGMCEKLQRRD